MRIVYIATSIIPSRTANSIHVMKMCQAFAQNGHEVTLIVPDWKEGVEPGIEDVYEFYGVEECFEIEFIPRYLIKGGGLLFGYQAARKSKQLEPDLVYGRALFGCFFSSLLKLPMAFETHAPLHKVINIWIFRKLIRMPSFQKLVVITHALEKNYSNSFALTLDMIHVAPDGADPLSEDVVPIQYPNIGKKVHVGYIGHLYSGRGIDIIQKLAERCPYADFHVIGGTEQDIEAYTKQTEFLHNLYIYGFMHPSVVDQYRLGCDILLAPYQKRVSVAGGGGNTVDWMSPLKIFEYMAAGKAIISSDLPVLREVLEDGRNALLCDSEDIDSWEKAIQYLSEDPEFRKQLGQNAQSDLIQKYSWQTRAQSIINGTKDN